MPKTTAPYDTNCNYCGIDIRKGEKCIVDQYIEPYEYYCMECGL